ncbi:hypothetical protein A616_16990 [Brevibacillus brevis X23]|nr:hypothetical protein A616_16990 [Brevibacillus brevis X23]
MPKYKLSVPDPNMLGMKVSGVKLNKNPFKTKGEILLKIDRGGIVQYTVISSNLPQCFPVGEAFWSTTHMFCSAMNDNLNLSKNPSDTFRNLEASSIQHHSHFFLFSKHKVDDEHWKVLVYDPEEDLFNPHVDNFIEVGGSSYEFAI